MTTPLPAEISVDLDAISAMVWECGFVRSLPSEPEEGQEYEPGGEQELRVPDRGGGDRSRR